MTKKVNAERKLNALGSNSNSFYSCSCKYGEDVMGYEVFRLADVNVVTKLDRELGKGKKKKEGESYLPLGL